MTREIFSCALPASPFALSFMTALILALSALAQAQQPAKIRGIGYLTTGSTEGHSRNFEAFVRGLRQLGYVEDQRLPVTIDTVMGNLNVCPIG